MREELLKFVREIKSNKELFSFDEAATKQGVILKILLNLGWDPFNIDEIHPEYSVGSERVDFSLRHNNSNKVFLEAKRVGENLEKHQEQLLSYSFKYGVKIAILTNGITWWFYLPLLEGDWEERRFYNIEIYEQSAEDIVKKFNDFLSKQNVVSGKAVENAGNIYKSKQRTILIKATLPKAWGKLITEPDELLVELIAETTEKLCGYKPDDEMVKKFVISDIKLKKESAELPGPKHPPPSKTVPERHKKKPILLPKSSLVFYIKAARGANAKAEINQEGIVIKQGSEIATSVVTSMPDRMREQRQKLIDNGVVAQEANKLVFCQDFILTSSSTAAAIVMGRNANGRTEWKDEKGRTLKSYQEQNM